MKSPHGFSTATPPEIIRLDVTAHLESIESKDRTQPEAKSHP
jgi:hypothetical protein